MSVRRRRCLTGQCRHRITARHTRRMRGARAAAGRTSWLTASSGCSRACRPLRACGSMHRAATTGKPHRLGGLQVMTCSFRHSWTASAGPLKAASCRRTFRARQDTFDNDQPRLGPRTTQSRTPTSPPRNPTDQPTTKRYSATRFTVSIDRSQNEHGLKLPAPSALLWTSRSQFSTTLLLNPCSLWALLALAVLLDFRLRFTPPFTPSRIQVSPRRGTPLPTRLPCAQTASRMTAAAPAHSRTHPTPTTSYHTPSFAYARRASRA